ncbi:hypothetical protein Taro_022030 [Colocasia esculenta]|uniref:Uncharacterized protein n=1 Tax=Colocasia esculenta TaxID=4460 RepID=A0A843V458_COLES|nr:hypothetical protein [Colocasia esculenta]
MFGGIYRLKQHLAGNVSKCPSCPMEVRNEIKAYMKGKKIEKLLTTQQQQQLQDEISGRQIRRDYTLPINVDDDEDDDDDDPDPEFTAAARASRRSYVEEDEKRRGLGTSGAHLSRDDSRRSLPRSTSVRRAAGALGCGGRLSNVHAPTQGPMDAYLYRSRSVKQPGIKQALKGVKATAKAAKGAIKGYFFNPRIQYKDNVHNDREVMRGTMNVITRLARTMTERLDAMAEVERYKLKLGIYGGYEMTYVAQRLSPGTGATGGYGFGGIMVGQTPLESAGSTDPTRPGSGSAGSDPASRPDSAILDLLSVQYC